MEDIPRTIKLSIAWKGNKYTIEIDSNANLKDLGNKLKNLTGVKADTLRLIVPLLNEKGSRLILPFSDEHSSLSLQDSSIVEDKTVRMMGVSEEEVDGVLKDAMPDLRILGFQEEEKRLRQKKSLYVSNSAIKLPQGSYIFCDFRTLQLPGIELNPPPSAALKRMHMLAADPGIIAVMNKHRWRVGIMTELAPVGYVGVSPKCLLGFNKNQGEEISLRLRTDDLKGFRKYASIKKTLLHELAHMVYTDHDENFYALNSQLNKEAESLDWTKSRGHTLNGPKVKNDYDEEEDLFFDENENVPHRLGGNQFDNLGNARESSVAAAYRRLSHTSENKDISVSKTNKEPDTVELSTPEDYSVPIDTIITQPATTQPADLSIKEGESMNVPPGELPGDTPPGEGERMMEVDEPDPDDEGIQRIQDPVTVIIDRLKKAINALKTEVEGTNVLQMVLKIVRNIIERPNEMKFKRLRKGNPTIKRNILNFPAAVEILSVIGFVEDMVSEGTGAKEPYLVFKRNDPGLLWISKSMIESHFTGS